MTAHAQADKLSMGILTGSALDMPSKTPGMMMATMFRIPLRQKASKHGLVPPSASATGSTKARTFTSGEALPSFL